MKEIILGAIMLCIGTTTKLSDITPLSGVERDNVTSIQINTVTATATAIQIGVDTLIRQSNDTFYRIPISVIKCD